MKLFLCGGGFGEQTKLTNKRFNEVVNHTKPLLYIPFAWDDDTYSGCLEFLKNELSEVEIPYIEMVKNIQELENKDLSNYSSIFIGGGNTYKLLKMLKESTCYQQIVDFALNDGIIYGSSAGAVILGKDIDIIKEMDPNEVNLKDTTGFNLIDGISIFPHYTNRKSKLTEEENDMIHNRYTQSIIDFSLSTGEVIAIPEENTVFYNNGQIEIIGTLPYYVIKNGNIEKNPGLKGKTLK